VRQQLGRQLTRVGALSRRLKLLPIAELSLRVATHLHPDRAWYIRLALIHEARKQWDKADEIYKRFTSSDPCSTDDRRYLGIAHYRRARLCVRRKDWDSAEVEFAEALRLRPDIAAWHAHRAQSREARQDWDGAIDSYKEASRLDPSKPEWLTSLVRAYMKARRMREAIRIGVAGLTDAHDHVPLIRAVAEAHEAIGDWHAAAALLRGLIAHRGADYSLRSQLVRCLEHLYRVPFQLGPDGVVTTTTTQEGLALSEAALAEAVEVLRYMSTHPSTSAPDLVRLGILYERSGRLIDAADTYKRAIERLPAIDSWWCHKAAYDWVYRLEYVEEQLRPADPPRWHLRRSVRPAGPSRTGEPAGFFDAMIARDGLQLSGFLLPTDSDFVEFRLDDLFLKQIRVYAVPWRSTFRFDVSKGTLRNFPARCRLSALVDGRPLVTFGGAAALEIHVAEGTGRITKKLQTGDVLTKKGHWPLSGPRLVERRQRYLNIYERIRDLLEGTDRQLFLCYGTLLGCHREGGFISGDDDFDASYVSTAPSPERYRQECFETALLFLRHGLDVAFAINGRMFKVGTDKVWIDVGPMWFHRGRALSFVAHDLDRGMIEPLRTTTFNGRRAYVPREPAAFLADTYGSDWSTPRSDFRYYRSPEDNRILSQMWAKPSEVRKLARRAEALRKTNAGAGAFMGVGVPAYPGFSWLVPADGDVRVPYGNG
jgi:tetratricopeptide (TPR) repeat protein